MTDRTATRLARAALALFALFFGLSIAFEVLAMRLGKWRLGWGDTLFLAAVMSFPLVGSLILSRQPRNRIGWILMTIGLFWTSPLDSYGYFALLMGLPGGAVSLALGAPLWAPPIGLMGTSLLLRFPNGNLLSRKWRKVEWVSFFAITLAVLAIWFSPGEIDQTLYPNLTNPLGLSVLSGLENFLMPVIGLIPVSIVASAVSLVMRFRRSSGTERLQLKWLASAGAVVAVLYLITMIASIGNTWSGAPSDPLWLRIFQNIALTSFLLIPASIGLAVLRYRLYDINLFISKTLMYGGLVVFITAIYLTVVIGIGALVGGRASLPLSIAATALIAIGFQPFRMRAQAIANRLVYGQRVSPYEAMAEFSRQMSGVPSIEEVLPRMAETAAKGIGAAKARVRVFLLDGTDRASVWPIGSAAQTFDKTISVRYGDEDVGEISVAKAPGESINQAEERLLNDLASQAGLALRNVRLTEELRASRQRIVKAQDEERRRMERDIHDGAQQQLVAMSVKLGIAESLLRRDPEKVSPILGELKSEASQAVETLRDLARGVFPQVLADRGLADAVASHMDKMGMAGAVSKDSVPRLSQDVETAVYFVIREALQNASKHASNSEIDVSLSYVDGDLVFEVKDQGPGFDPESNGRGSGMQNMRDRIEALGGSLDIESRSGAGTTVRGKVPALVLELG